MGFTPSMDDHLDEMTVAAYVGRRLVGDALARTEGHLAACAECREEVALITDIVRTQRRSSRRIWIPLTVAAALALISLPVLQRDVPVPEAVQRELPDVSRAGPSIREPEGVVSQVRALIWSPVSGATRYRPTILDPEGNIVWDAVVRDTIALLPDSVRFERDRTYYWKVDAQLGTERRLSSRLARFRLGEP